MSVRLVRLVRVFAVLAVASLLAGAAGLAWIAHALHDLSADVAVSHQRLPPRVPGLASGGNMLDQRQVTLVRYSAGVSRGAAVLLVTLPDKRRVSFVTLPPSATLHGKPLKHMGMAELTRALDRDVGTPVSHVVLIEPNAVGTLVQQLGGVEVTNPRAFTAVVDGTTEAFPRGRLALNGDRADVFAHVVTTREPLETASSSLLLAGVVHRLVAPTSVQRLRELGGELANAVSTDLGDDDVLGLVELRLRGGTALECLAPRRSPADSGITLTMLERARGASTATAGARCHVRPVPAATVAPPLAVIRLAQRYGWRGFAAGAAATLALAVATVLLLAWRWPRARRPASIWPPLPGPDSGDVVWSGRPQSQQPPAPDQPAPAPEPERPPTRARDS